MLGRRRTGTASRDSMRAGRPTTDPLQDRLDILHMLDHKIPAIAVEMRPDEDTLHHEVSVTQRVPAVAVTRPLVAALIAEMR